MTSERDVLLSLQAVRERAGKVLQAAESDSLNHFSFHASRMAEVVDYVTGVIDVSDLPPKKDAAVETACSKLTSSERLWPRQV